MKNNTLEETFAGLGKSLDDFFDALCKVVAVLSGSASTKKAYVTWSGKSISIDETDRALRKYATAEGVPLKHGMRVRVNFTGRNATVKGVGPTGNPCKKGDVVWYLVDGRDGINYGYPVEQDDFSLCKE